MSKELEALSQLDSLAQTYESDYTTTKNNYQEAKNRREGLTETIRKALTPPTADEVCKAFHEYTQYDVLYDENLREFTLKDGSWITRFGIYGYQVVVYLHPSLITLISRFYEGIE